MYALPCVNKLFSDHLQELLSLAGVPHASLVSVLVANECQVNADSKLSKV